MDKLYPIDMYLFDIIRGHYYTVRGLKLQTPNTNTGAIIASLRRLEKIGLIKIDKGIIYPISEEQHVNFI